MYLRLPTFVFLLCALLGPSALAQRAAPGPAPARAASADTARDARLVRADRGRVRGKPDAIWIVVISDFQCPFCKKWHEETMPAIERNYVQTGKAQIAYMNFPIPGSHPNAVTAHELAMCAAEQGQFWPAADALFRMQRNWGSRSDLRTVLDSIARGLAIDQRRYAACMDSREMRSLVDADYVRATQIGASSTPSFLIGGRPLIGAQPYAAFQRAIDAALAEQSKAAPKNGPTGAPRSR